MSTNLDTLRAQPLSLIGPATQTLADGGSIGAWRKAMEVAIKRSQTAAYIAATAERLGTSPKLIKGLSWAERAELDKRINAQLKYLDGFVADLKAGKLTMAQAQARANLYAGPTRGYRSIRPKAANVEQTVNVRGNKRAASSTGEWQQRSIARRARPERQATRIEWRQRDVPDTDHRTDLQNDPGGGEGTA